jgi:hypothetical protein
MTKIFFSPLSFVAVFGSGMGKNPEKSATLIYLLLIFLGAERQDG